MRPIVSRWPWVQSGLKIKSFDAIKGLQVVIYDHHTCHCHHQGLRGCLTITRLPQSDNNRRGGVPEILRNCQIVKANYKRTVPRLPIGWCVVPCHVETVVGALHLEDKW